MSVMSKTLDADRCAAARAHPNIALIKYWGKRDLPLNLPVVGSLSITLDTLWTRTSVRFAADLPADRLSLNGREDAKQLRKVSACLDLLRARAGTRDRAEIVSRRPGWEQVPAVRHGRVHAVTEAFLGRPGPRLVEGYRRLRAAIEAARR